MNIFEEVKSHTDIKTAAEHFGLTVRNGICPHRQNAQYEAVQRPFPLFQLRNAWGRYKAGSAYTQLLTHRRSPPPCGGFRHRYP